MIIKNNLEIEGSAGKPIRFDVNMPNDNHNMPLVIFSHGFKGFKDWGHYHIVAQHFAQSKCIFVKHNFSHNGISSHSLDQFDELDAFSENSLSFELNDLDLLLTHLLQHSEWKNRIDQNKICLLGHSKGGAISILKAAHDHRIKKIITWASLFDFNRHISKEMLKAWKETGVIYFENTRTKQMMPIRYQVYEDYLRHHKIYHVPSMASNITIPHLIIHGTNDLSIPVAQAQELNAHSKFSKMLIIEGADHSFNIAHPFTNGKISDESIKAIEASIRFVHS
ncbi:MAG TPA: acetylxylan esterase [Bacteroidia bacterium]|nr:acetylxylan esterase [Bacteroidia bacterium]HNT80995.1 acetylxylan esterase [Bacteroidia bacterium]